MKTLLKLFPLCLLAGCAHAHWDPDPPRPVDLSGVGHGMIVLGERLQDPYSLENMTLAVRSVYPEKASRMDLRPTDIYVRFLPDDDKQFEHLESLGLDLLDHPLDYRILQEGDYYHDPEIPDGRITWQYAVVPAGFSFPTGIRMEILDECYIAEHAGPTRSADVDWSAVERESFRLTGNADLLSPATRSGEAAQVPTGRITVLDENCGGGVPAGVSGVKVCVNSFVKFATAYTDDNGYYELPKSFSEEVRYRLLFRNRRGFSIGVNLLLVPASVSTLGRHDPTGIDVVVDKDTDWKLFTRCAVNNIAAGYFDRCREEGDVSAPPADLRIWIFRNLGSSSTLMLQQGVLLDSGKVGEFLGEYASLVQMFLPDITLGLKHCHNYAEIYSETVHELSHASHYVQVGNAFWSRFIRFILKSYVTSLGITYGTGLEEDAGYCEVGEMWGYYFGNLLFRERYGSGTPAEGLSLWFYPQILMYLDERGVDAAKIFSILGPDVTDKDAFQEALTDRYPEHFSVINQAFDRYRL
ncbi:MAG: hypothetical protein IJ654_09895 [Bacteroidales bacterium]|nr:hypothetical protein [Bacteroidales bacterium]